MIGNVLKGIIGGIGVGALLTFIVFTIMLANDVDIDTYMLWKSMLCNMVVGAYFSTAGYIFAYHAWSPLKQLIIHYGLSLAVFYPIAFWAEWIHIEFIPILLSLLMFTAIYAVFWVGFTLYYRNQTKKLNESVNQKGGKPND